MQELVPPSAPH